MSTPDLIRSLDPRGRPLSPAAVAGYQPSRTPATKGRRFPPDPLAIEDVVQLLAACTPQRPGSIGELSALRLRSLLIVLWRTGLRISEALALEERDLNRADRAVVVRQGKGDKRRLTMMDEWGWTQLAPWLKARPELPPGQVFCVLTGPTAGRAMHDSEARRQIREAGQRAGIRRRTHAHGLRHTHAVELWREGLDVYTIQNQLGHARLDVTAAYLRGVAVTEVLAPIGRRAAPMMPVPSA